MATAGIPSDRGNFDQADITSAVSDHLLPEPLPDSPWGLFRSWWDRAHAGKIQPNPNAMTLATVGDDGRPSARIVLCKGMDLASGHFIFYTNERGRKGRELLSHPHAALVFHWDDLDKQVRIEGPVLRSPASESDVYYASRPWLSRIGAWTSDQSEPVASRAALAARLDDTLRRFNIDPANLPPKQASIDIPRPAHWGGFRIYAQRVELWCGGEGRLHERASWERTLVRRGDEFVAEANWKHTRLQP